MSLVLDSVAGGFLLATRRLPLVLADLAAKLVWVLATGAIFVAALFFALVELAPPSQLPPDAAGLYLAVAIALRWPDLVRILVVGLFVSFSVWTFVEAFIRSRIFEWTWGTPDEGGFVRFLASGFLRRAGFGLTAVTLGAVVLGPGLSAESGQWSQIWPEIRWAAMAAGLLLVVVAFVLMLLDTLLRCGAVEAMGADLGAIVAAVGIVGLVEVVIRLSALMGTVILMHLIPVSAVLIVGAPVIAVLLSIVHSYLLLVRYSAIGIMRHRSET